MFSRLSHLITGTVRFQIQGNAPRLFTVAGKSGLGLWGFARAGEDYSACCKPREYKRLAALRRRCGVRLHMEKKRGLPFQVYRLTRRKGFLLGVGAGILLYAYLSTFVWNIQVTGNETITPKQLLDAARESNIYVGAPRSGFRSRASANEILLKVEGISWMSVNDDGCFIELAIKETERKPEISDESTYSNLVASRPGKILSIAALHGKPEVKLGDTVEEGQLLVSGIYSPEIDPYGVQPPEIPILQGSAEGSIMAETYREFTVQVSSRTTVSEKIGERQEYELTLLGITLPLGLRKEPQSEFIRWEQRSSLTLLGTELPVGLIKTVYEFQQEKEMVYTREEQERQALLKLRELQKSTLPEGSSVLKEDLEYAFADGICVLNAQCRCKEEIGKIQEILVNEYNLEE